MNETQLESYLHEHIPLSLAMGIGVASVSVERVVLRVPLAPNLNHRETLFGGSASAAAILAAWSLLYVRLQGEAPQGRIVIHSNTMAYKRLVDGDCLAIAEAPDAELWDRLLRALHRRRIARVVVHSRLEHAGAVAGEFEGVFAVLPQHR